MIYLLFYTHIFTTDHLTKCEHKITKRCLLIDWVDEEGNVAEGRILSSDPNDIVNDSRLGPTDVKVLVDAATEPGAFYWRPASNMCTIKEAVRHIIA